MTKSVPNETKSISKQVKEILGKRPLLVNALLQNIVNYSALARYVQRELSSKTSIEAVKASIIREKRNLTKQKSFNEERILKLLKNSRIELRDKIAVIITNKTFNIQYLASSVVISGLIKHNVYITDQTELEIKESADTEITKNLVALIIKSPDEIEKVAGYVAFITQLLVGNGINIKEFISCYTDTVIVLTKDEGLKAFSLLQKYV